MEVWRLRTATQLMEVKVLAGPPGSEVEALCVTDEAPPPPRGKRGLVVSSLRYDAAIRQVTLLLTRLRCHLGQEQRSAARRVSVRVVVGAPEPAG